MRTVRVRVTLREVEPVVVRVLDVPAVVVLPELHELLQGGLGWTDSHLHQFVTDDAAYGMPDVDGPAGERDESHVALRKLPARFVYLYDFGDGWEHDVDVLGPGGDRPGCVYGEGMCPPEDCGGPPGYAQLRAVLADSTHPEHAERRAWAGEWAGFNQNTTDLRVAQTVGAVPAPVRLVLDLTAGGVRLTPGGRLPRALVRQVQHQYPAWHPTGRPAHLEEDLPPLAALHDLLRGVGLLRLRRGVVTPIRAAADEVAVIRRLRSWFGPAHGFTNVLAGVSLAVLATSGPQSLNQLAARVYPLVGRGWVTRDGQQPLTDEHVRMVLTRITTVLQGLDLIDTDMGTWAAGPCACWLLPRATGLTHLWSTTAPVH